MRMRLKAEGNPHSPGTALELLRHSQKHRVSIGENAYSNFSKATAAKLDLFEALALKTP